MTRLGILDYHDEASRQVIWDMCQTKDGWEHDDAFAVDLAPEGDDAVRQDGTTSHILPFSFFLVLAPVADGTGAYRRIACFNAGWNHVERGVMKCMLKKRGERMTLTIV